MKSTLFYYERKVTFLQINDVHCPVESFFTLYAESIYNNTSPTSPLSYKISCHTLNNIPAVKANSFLKRTAY
jgi:hypothetical protein